MGKFQARELLGMGGGGRARAVCGGCGGVREEFCELCRWCEGCVEEMGVGAREGGEGGLRRPCPSHAYGFG